MVNFGGYFLVFCLKTLPPKPWPVTIAGVPSYLTTDPNDGGPSPPIKRASKTILRISPDIDGNYHPEKMDDIFELVKKFFLQAKISITEIQYWNNFLVIALEYENTDLTKVPSAIARCCCFYLFESEMGRPIQYPTKRIQEPTDNVVDNSQYDILRPGIMLSSGKDETGMEILTTSGALVQDSLGDQYMTVASHGFLHTDRVFHPLAGHREIGK